MQMSIRKISSFVTEGVEKSAGEKPYHNKRISFFSCAITLQNAWVGETNALVIQVLYYVVMI